MYQVTIDDRSACIFHALRILNMTVNLLFEWKYPKTFRQTYIFCCVAIILLRMTFSDVPFVLMLDFYCEHYVLGNHL